MTAFTEIQKRDRAIADRLLSVRKTLMNVFDDGVEESALLDELDAAIGDVLWVTGGDSEPMTLNEAVEASDSARSDVLDRFMGGEQSTEDAMFTRVPAGA